MLSFLRIRRISSSRRKCSGAAGEIQQNTKSKALQFSILFMHFFFSRKRRNSVDVNFCCISYMPLKIDLAKCRVNSFNRHKYKKLEIWIFYSHDWPSNKGQTVVSSGEQQRNACRVASYFHHLVNERLTNRHKLIECVAHSTAVDHQLKTSFPSIGHRHPFRCRSRKLHKLFVGTVVSDKDFKAAVLYPSIWMSNNGNGKLKTG